MQAIQSARREPRAVRADARTPSCCDAARVTQVKQLRDASRRRRRSYCRRRFFRRHLYPQAPRPRRHARVDLPKAATTVRLETIFAAADLSGVSVIDTELAFIRESGVSIRSQATAMLNRAYRSSHPHPDGRRYWSSSICCRRLPEAAVRGGGRRSDLKAAVASAFDASVFA